MALLTSFKHIPFKHISNEIIFPKGLISKISKLYINHNKQDDRKYNNFTPHIYIFSSYDRLLESLDTRNKLSSQLEFVNETITIPNKIIIGDIKNQIYCRDISSKSESESTIDNMPIILSRFWFKYTHVHEQIEFISIYELANNINKPQYWKQMNKYYRIINDNKVYPNFNDNDTKTFLTNIQNLY